MPLFLVIVTRDTTESVAIPIKAKDQNEATEVALHTAINDAGSLVWAQDDTPNASSDPYVTDVSRED